MIPEIHVEKCPDRADLDSTAERWQVRVSPERRSLLQGRREQVRSDSLPT